MILAILLASNLWAMEPREYSKKTGLSSSARIVGDQIIFNYGFKDLKGEYQEWSWQDDYSKLKNLSDQFGVTVRDPNNPSYVDGDLTRGLFVKHPLVGAIPDYDQLISLYQVTVFAIYQNWKKMVEAQNLTRRDSIELLLRFLQDYPYGIPPNVVGSKFIGGLLVPPLSLEKGWADCDSKSLLMASVLSFDSYFRDKMAMILVPGHALLGIEVLTLPYDETYKFQNRTFIVAEPTGLSRTPFGRKNSPYSRVLAVIPLSPPTLAEVSLPNPTSLEGGMRPLVESDCPEGGLLVEHFSQVEKGKIQVCMIKEGESFIKHGPLLKYDSVGRPKEKEVYRMGKKI